MVLTIEAVGNDGTEGNAGLDCLLDELDRNRQLGPEVRIGLALREVVGGRVGLDVEWVVQVLVGPETGHAHHPGIDLPQIGQILLADVCRLAPPLPIAVLIDHQHTVGTDEPPGLLP